MNLFFRYKPIFEDRPDKLLHFSSSSLRDEDEYGLSLRDVALYLNKRNCLEAFKVKVAEQIIDLEGFSFVDHLIFPEVKIFKKVFFRCKRAYDEGLIDQKKLFRGVYFQKEIEEKLYPKIEVKWVAEGIGYGVFAEENISKNAFVGEYVGIVKKKSFFQKQNSYTMRYPTLFSNKNDYIIDAEKLGNFTRFINHSSDPNLDLESVFISPFTRMIFTATKKIKKGDQLTFDYGKLFWKKRKYRDI